jgi:hypothetical protein
VGGFSLVHWLIFGVVAVLVFGSPLSALHRITHVDGLYLYKIQNREAAMRKLWKRFYGSPKFWATLGLLSCIAGAYFQRVAANGTGLWCLGLIFLGAAYLEKHEYWPG